jgi:hypothetical protein
MLIDRKVAANLGLRMGMEPEEAKAGAMYLAQLKTSSMPINSMP